MSHDQKETKRKQFLLTNLIILTIIILGLVFIIAAYPTFLAPEPTKTPTITYTPSPSSTYTQIPTSTQTPTITTTPRPTFSPTITRTPTITLTPTPTLTPIGPATLTPAWPVANNNLYNLTEWTAEKADNMVTLVDNYPNTLALEERGDDNAAYFAAYEYAVLAQEESILRFPESTQSITWRWGLAYNLARIGDPKAGGRYANLIAESLNSGETDLSSLKRWFQEREPRMELHMLKLEALSGYLGSYLVEVRGDGSAYIWLLESSNAFNALNLVSHFDFVNESEGGWIISDLNGNEGDGEEAAFYFTNPPNVFHLQPPAVFNLGSFPVDKLPFVPEKDISDIGMEFFNYWVVSQDVSGQNDLVFETTLFPVCPVTIKWTYHWNGVIFEFVKAQYIVEPIEESLNYCDFIVDHAIEFWGPDAAIQIMEPLLTYWPPSENEEGKAFPVDAKDEWRYRLGVYHSLIGNSKVAKDYMSDIIANPSFPNSRWIDPAKEFLEIYKLPDDVYRACIQSQFCIPAYAVEFLVDNLPADEFPNVIEHLYDWGLSPLSSGYFDFEGDGENERWFTVRHRPVQKPEFWILAAYPNGGKALLVGSVDSNPPTVEYLEADFVSEEAVGKQPVVFVDSTIPISMHRVPGSQEPYIVYVPLREEWPNRFEEGFKQAEDTLFASGDPKKVREELVALQKWPGLLCKTSWTCDRYYYMLGLASELTGYESNAVDAYLTLWREYSKSPFTTMARLKLEGIGMPAPAVPTHTSTPSGTFIPIPTIPGVTPTPTPTGATPTPSPTGATPTPTPTGPTPTPSPTGATPTPTLTEPPGTPYPYP